MVLTTDPLAMFDDWPELSSLLSRALPTANVNYLYPEAEGGLQDRGEAVALEMRPSCRLIEDASVLPAKWTVIIFQASPGTLCVNLLKVDRQMAEQTEFGTPQTMELVEYLKCHPLLSSKWAYCRGIQDESHEESCINDTFCGRSVKRSASCELLLKEEINNCDRCRFCAQLQDGTTNEEPSTNEDTSMSLPIECDIFLEPAQNFEKPEKTYAQLIAEALMQSVDGILAPRDICSCISQKYPYYDMNTRSWMKCVTSTLNSNPIFRSHAKDDDGRSYLWMIDDGAKGENSCEDEEKTISIPFETEEADQELTERPEATCAEMIADALFKSRDGMLTAKSIFTHIGEKYPYFSPRNRNLQMRKNVRNTLSRDRRFQMGPKANEIAHEDGEGEDGSSINLQALNRTYMWTIKEDAKSKFQGSHDATPKSEVTGQDMSGLTLKTEVKDEPEDISDIGDPSSNDGVGREGPELKARTSAVKKPKRRKKPVPKRRSLEDLMSMRPKGPKKFACSFCDEEFSSRNLLNSHISTSHGDKPMLKFRSFYRQHVTSMERMAKTIELECNSCNRTFFQVKKWVDHMQQHKGDAGVYIPDPGEYRSIRREYRRKEAMDHYFKRGGAETERGKFICEVCGKKMARTSKYKHLRDVHKVGPVAGKSSEHHKCTWESCDFETYSEQSLRKHTMIHNNEKPFVCPHCGKAFRTNHQLQDCIRRCTGEGLLECSKCGKGFTRRLNLENHERQHEGLRPFACNLCSCTYVCKKNLDGHIKRVHT